jgi:hypothetical protein
MMDKGSELILAEILKKTQGEITDYDRQFLRARRSYVSTAELERLGVTLEEEVKAEKPLSQMNKGELLAKAAEMGVQVPDGATTNKEIVALLSQQ